MSKGQNSFVKGAAILAAAGLIVKIIGAVFRIPLANLIGEEGMANYQVAYPFYATLVVISTAGLPTAISKMVSERVTVGDYRSAHKVFQTALKLLFLIGIISTAVMFAFSSVIADAANIPSAQLGLMLISPSLFFVAILSAYRGYFQGLQQMTPTAVTQLIEQVVKLAAGLFLASLWVSKGAEFGAAGALLGVTLSEVCALVLIVGFYNRKKKDIKANRRISSKHTYKTRYRKISTELLAIAFPIILGASIMPIIMQLDTFIINNVMPTVDYSAYNLLTAEQSFGVLSGFVNPVINMPAVLSLALCMSLVPAISEARAKRDDLAISNRSGMGFKLAMFIGLPSAIGLFILAQPIYDLLYSGRLNNPDLTAEEIATIKEGLRIGANLLRTLSIGVLFLTILQTMTGILQGAGKVFVPLINLAIGAAVKVVLSIVLIRIPSLNINGAAIGTAACYGIAAILNVIAVIRITKPKIRVVSGVLMPIVSTVAMGILVYYLYDSLEPVLGNTKATLLCLLGAVLVYGIMLFVTGAIKKQDMAFIPGGNVVTRFMNKLGFWED